MADRFSVDDYTLPYGSVGGAGAKAMQAEVLRRLAMEEARQQEELRRQEVAVTRERQARMDADALKTSAVNRRVAEENVASNADARGATAAEREQKTRDAKVKSLLGSLRAGSKVSAEQRKAAEELGQGHLFQQHDVMGPDAEETVTVEHPLGPEDVGPQAPSTLEKVKKPGVATGAKEDIFLGTPEQQKDEEAKSLRREILAGKYRNDPRYGKDERYTRIADYIETNAQMEELGIDKAGAAQLLAAPKSATETKAQHDLNMQQLAVKKRMGESLTALEQAQLADFENRAYTPSERQTDALARLVISNTNALNRQQSGFGQQNRTNLITNVENDQKVYQNQGEAAIKGINLLDKGGTADMAAVSQFLTATSGGFGSGQRINDTELNAVLESRPLWDSWMIEAQRLTSVGKTINKLTPAQREQMKSMLQLALQDATVAIDQNIKTVEEAGDAALATHWRKTRERIGKKGSIPVPATTNDSSDVVGDIDPKTGKLVLRKK